MIDPKRSRWHADHQTAVIQQINQPNGFIHRLIINKKSIESTNRLYYYTDSKPSRPKPPWRFFFVFLTDMTYTKNVLKKNQ